MIVTIHPSQLSGELLAPRSKSSMQRACAASLLHVGTTHIIDPGFSNDDLAAIDTIQKLGAKVVQEEGKLTVTSNGIQPLSGEINCGESGLGIRMFTPIAALSNQQLTMNGSGSLVVRPMHFFDEIFPLLDINIQSNNGRLPMHIQGPLQPKDITVDGSLSSQFLTGLLMAFSAAGARDCTITVNKLTSKPYIDLTLDVMKAFGMKLPEVDEYEKFYFDNTAAVAAPLTLSYRVEGDWSGAAFLLVAGAVAGGITVTGLQPHSTQADKAILKALELCGADMDVSEEKIIIRPAALKAFVFDATECPDLFPPLAALAANCKGTTVIQGALRLTHKESDRASTLKEEFGRLGVLIELDGDFMRIHGGGKISGGIVHSHHDHRIAMAMAVAALNAEGPVTIEEAQSISKSYPEFYSDLKKAGVVVQEISAATEGHSQH
jgi:3-phosphoshikimate 1-carboxyvinyltransferase